LTASSESEIIPGRIGETGEKALNIIRDIDRNTMRMDLASFQVGDRVRVHTKRVEGAKERVQVFEGVVTRRRRAGAGSTFTVRKISYSIGVERIFPLYSPMINRIEVLSQGRVRRAKLYYLRKLTGKAAKIKEKKY
jgi:large subunit ribosomal protein L19